MNPLYRNLHGITLTVVMLSAGCVDSTGDLLGGISPANPPLDIVALVQEVGVGPTSAQRRPDNLPAPTNPVGPTLQVGSGTLSGSPGATLSVEVQSSAPLQRLDVTVLLPTRAVLGYFELNLAAARVVGGLDRITVSLDLAPTLPGSITAFELQFVGEDFAGLIGRSATRLVELRNCVDTCLDGDGCCPAGCSANDDEDCDASCDNGVLELGEDCDLTDLGGESCASQGFGSGELRCTDTCEFDFERCDGCGNDVVDHAVEQCDGPDLDGESCARLGFDGGTLACGSGCRFDTGQCHDCGDGTANGDEACDRFDLDGQTCVSQGFDGGVLGCTNACRFDLAECVECGDDDREGNEQCDGSDLGGQTCVSQGFSDGTLACDASCRFDTGDCVSPCEATIEVRDAFAVDLNPAAGSYFVSQVEVNLELSSSDAVREVEFVIAANPDLDLITLGCSTTLPGFVCELEGDPGLDPGPFKIYSPSGGLIAAGNSRVIARLAYRLNFTVLLNSVLIILTPDQPVVLNDRGGACAVEVESGGIRVDDN